MLRNEPVQPWAERTVPPASSPSQIHWLQLRDWSGDDTEENPFLLKNGLD